MERIECAPLTLSSGRLIAHARIPGWFLAPSRLNRAAALAGEAATALVLIAGGYGFSGAASLL